MAIAATIEQSSALVPVNNAAAAVVLFDNEKFDAFYAKLKADIDATPVDLSTKKGRDAIASAAAKVRSEKASIDRDRKRLTQEWRDNTALVNGAWKGIEARLDDLAIAARKPLTEWEQAEKARIDRCNEIISDIHGAAIVTLDDTAESVRLRGMKIWAIEIGGEFGALAHDAEQAKSATIATLQAALARLKKEEAERAELEKLRAAEAQRLAKEQAEREAREAEDRAAAEARAAEERRIAAEKAEQERIERARAEAAEAERQRIQREHEEALAVERRRAEEAERARHAEIDRIAKEEAERQAEAERIAAEQAKRDADQKHKTAVMKAAKEAIMTCGADEETAKKIVLLIRSGDVPNVTMRF
ncbi:hypothetical protein [Sphingobium sp. CFD-1]|uniref:hypothetical protein n=1 Tax=Sphingobium sp. CFD-1 TaxID=2878545 RepID=UPI00214C929E|nr:hypothetical protein [Sphingobium sp. CFD-1]